MAQQIQLRRGTASQWTSVNPVLAQGEPGVETDTGKFKIGDGSSAWTALAYVSAPDATTGSKGMVQIAGDLAGTAAAPTVPGLANKVDTTRQITAGTGLTGGGSLAADRTLAVTYGTASGTAAQGNDSRLTGALQATSNLSDLASAATARTNLGLGTSATLPSGAVAQTANNLSDLASSAAARGNLGATQETVRTAVKTAAYAASSGDLIPVDTTAGNVTVTLPTAPADKARVAVKHIIQGGTNTVTVACGGSDVLNKTGGNTSATLTLVNQGATYEYQAATHIWTVTAGDLPLSQLDTRFVQVFTPEAYGAKGDIKHVTDAAITSGTAALSSTAGAFTSADAGKLVAVEGAATASTTNPLGVLLTTISSVSGGVATLSASATATASGANCSYGTDDTTALTAFFAALSAAGTGGQLARGHLRSQYATSAAVSDGGGDYQLYGAAMTSLWKMDTGAIPTGPSVQQFPYIAGSAIVAFHTGQTAAITSGGNGQRIQWENIGIRFAKPFVSTGHGHLAQGPVVGGQTYHRTSLVQSRFINVACFGHDGNSYALRHLNAYRNRYDRVMSSGGGCVSNAADNGNFVWNNCTYIDLESHTFIGGTANCLDFTSTNSASHTNPVVIRPNFFISNLTSNYYPNSSPATSSQKFMAMTPSLMKGFTVIGADFECPSVVLTTAYDWPAASDTLASGSGFSFDTGHYMNGPSLPTLAAVDANSYVPLRFDVFATRKITAATDTFGAAGWKAAPITFYDATSNAIVVTLPTGTGSAGGGGDLTLKKVDASANTVTINAGGANKFYNSSGPTSLTLTAQGDGYRIIWDGTYLQPLKA